MITRKKRVTGSKNINSVKKAKQVFTDVVEGEGAKTEMEVCEHRALYQRKVPNNKRYQLARLHPGISLL
jgi:hypothetical protein